MRVVQYYRIQAGVLRKIEEQEAIALWNEILFQALLLDLWPQDLRLRPCTSVPLKKQYETGKETRVEQIIRLNREEKERSDQGVLVRINKASSPYAEEFTKRDDARNRAYLSKKVPKRRPYREEPFTQIEDET